MVPKYFTVDTIIMANWYRKKYLLALNYICHPQSLRAIKLWAGKMYAQYNLKIAMKCPIGSSRQMKRLA
jgi:hypothetical protein